ncbi:MAG: protein kinase, partial [Pseudomonadota bacterium]|nr:protein kinase [Pseudomonadota bacterium]
MSTFPPTASPPPAAVSGTDHDALPPGTRFGEFEIIRVLGVGGFGIVYLANDHSLEREVALKEYMPASLAARGLGPQITVRSSSFAETYAIGLRSFINEARLLARFDHPSLVKVYRFWEDNATAYMVMPFLQGVTLRDTRRRMAHPPDEAWIRSVITPILSALELLHREGVYHRDIAPDNILLPPDGPPVLLDFGAARRVISDRTQSLTAILKPSYAPIEQYAEMTQLRQGPWTDLYALGAVIHYLVFGVPPAPATARAVQDDADQIESRVVPGVSPRFLDAVAWMLAIRPNQRPQNAEQLRAVLDGHAEVPPRGRPGITIPPGAANPASTDGRGSVPARRGEAAPDHTLVGTAHMPTYLPTALVPPPSQQPSTNFSPTAQMPSPRGVSQFDAAPASSGQRPGSVVPSLPPSQWADSGQGALAQSNGGTRATSPTLPPMSQPAPLAGPAPAAAQAAARPLAAPSATRSSSPKLGLVIVGVAAVLAVVAVAAWQSGAKRGAADASAAAGSAGAGSVAEATLPTATPVITPPVAVQAGPELRTPGRADVLARPADTGAALPASAAMARATDPIARPPRAMPDAATGSDSQLGPARSPLSVADRNAAMAERGSTVGRSGGATDPNGVASRPAGRPVPRLGEADPTATASTRPSSRTADPYGDPSTGTG